MKTSPLILAPLVGISLAAPAPAYWNYAFNGVAPKSSAATEVAMEAVYTPEAGFGWLPGSKTVFAVKLPEGNYDVAVAYQTAEAAAAATVKAEARRLMVHRQTDAGSAARTFTVAVFTSALPGGGMIGVKGGEVDSETWNDRLTLEFLPDASAVSGLIIRPAPKAVTVFVAGDSTVTDQGGEPWGGWGQMLPRFFQPGVAVANYAGSGRALFSFRGERRLEKIHAVMKPGDYLFIQFGHNDQKDKAEGAGPFTTYQANLKQYVAATRAKGGIPVLVTPMERRRWSDGKPGETLGAYAEAVRQVAAEDKVALVDLHAMSLRLYGALGEEGSKRAFVHYPANTFPGRAEKLADNTHHNAYGAYELARCVVEGIRQSVPELAARLRDDAGAFDPSKPDAVDVVAIPPSPRIAIDKPEGN